MELPDLPPDSDNVTKIPNQELAPGEQPAVMVEIPEGVRGGQQFPVTINGQQLLIICPPQARPGMSVRIVPPPVAQAAAMATFAGWTSAMASSSSSEREDDSSDSSSSSDSWTSAMVAAAPLCHLLNQKAPEEEVLPLVDAASAKEKDGDGYLPLHYAARCGASDAVVAALLAANPEAAGEKDEDGMLPLHHAAGCGALDAVVAALLAEIP